MNRQRNAPVSVQADTGRGDTSADATNAPTIEETKLGRQTGMASYRVQNGKDAALKVALNGRLRWALDELISAGSNGCTVIQNPAPRWSGYVHELRALGVQIETIREPHGGPYPGTHGRYVLRSAVTLIRSGRGIA